MFTFHPIHYVDLYIYLLYMSKVKEVWQIFWCNYVPVMFNILREGCTKINLYALEQFSLL